MDAESGDDKGKGCESMSHFYGKLQGCRGQTTRCGSKGSGIRAHLRSWSNDCHFNLSDAGDGRDLLVINIPEGHQTLKVLLNGEELFVSQLQVR